MAPIMKKSNVERCREWRQKNPERVKIYRKEYKLKNPEWFKKDAEVKKIRRQGEEGDKMREIDRIYKKNNPKQTAASRKRYRSKPENRKKENIYGLKYYHAVWKKNPNAKLAINLRNRICKVLQGINKSKSTMKLVGCTIDELWQHLEKQFQLGMTKENYGKWHVDHRKACAKFDLTDPEQQRECFHWSNLQPLWAIDNIKKGAR